MVAPKLSRDCYKRAMVEADAACVCQHNEVVEDIDTTSYWVIYRNHCHGKCFLKLSQICQNYYYMYVYIYMWIYMYLSSTSEYTSMYAYIGEYLYIQI
jgi:hypothetical protein